MLVDVNRRLKRGKAFDQGRVQGRLAVWGESKKTVSLENV
jgi:hypothetical protein